jgi:PKD repeat protein
MKKQFIFLIILACIVIPVSAVPPNPMEFYGNVCLDGAPAPAGTVIVAMIDGTDHGHITTVSPGRYGGTGMDDQRLVVTVSEAEAACGCQILIAFTVNGKNTDQTAVFSSLATQQLDLSAGGGCIVPTATATVTATATATSTVSPTATATTQPVTSAPTTSTTSPVPTSTSIPVNPHEFFGTATIMNGDELAPVNTSIGVAGEGVRTGVIGNPILVTVPGRFGGEGISDLRLIASGNIPENSPLTFLVGGAPALVRPSGSNDTWSENYPFHAGGTTAIDLRTDLTQPVANFSAQPLTGLEPLPVRFTDWSTGSPSTWSWNFGDTGTSQEQNPIHSFYRGNYNVTLTVANIAGNSTITRTRYIEVTGRSGGGVAGGGGGGGGGGGYEPLITNGTATPTVTGTLTPTPSTTGSSGGNPIMLPYGSGGVINQSVVIYANDGVAAIAINNAVVPRTAQGEPPASITVTRLPSDGVPEIPPGSSFAATGYAYDIEPTGATFDPYVTLSFAIPPADWDAIKAQSPAIYWYNPTSGAWEELPTTTDAEKGILSAQITHTSVYAVLKTQSGAAITGAPTAVTTTSAPAAPFSGWIFTALVIVVIAIIILLIALVLLRRRLPPEPPAAAPPGGQMGDLSCEDR